MDVINTAIDAACSNNAAGAHWVVGLMGTSVIASIAANFRRLPAPLRVLADVAAGNFFALMKQKGAQQQKGPSA